MKPRDIILSAVGLIAVLAVVFALFPSTPPPTPIQTPVLSNDNRQVRADSPLGLGSIDAITSGQTITILARDRSEHGRTIGVRQATALAINGWAVTDRKHVGSALLFRIDSLPWSRAQYGITRPDVAQSLKDPADAASGFIANVPASAIPHGKHQIALAIDDGSRLEGFDDPILIDAR